MNLLVQRNTKWQLVLELKLWLGFERGSKCQILDYLTDEASKFYSCSRHHRLESQCMQVPCGLVHKLDIVSFHSALMRWFPVKNFLTIPLHFWQIWVQLRFFNLHLEMTLLVQRNTKLHLAVQLKPWLEFKRGSCSRYHRLESQCMEIPLGVLHKLDMVSFYSALMRCFPPKISWLYPQIFGKLGWNSDSSTCTWKWISWSRGTQNGSWFCNWSPGWDLRGVQNVRFWSTFLARWGVTQILQPALGNESPGPEEHKMAVGSGIKALVGIWEGFKMSDFGSSD